MEHPPPQFPALIETVSGSGGKEGRARLREQIRRSRLFRFLPRPRRLIRWSVLAGLALFLGPPTLKAIWSDPAEAFEPAADAVLYDRGGTVIQSWPERGDRRPVAFAELSPYLVNAILAREDQRFFSHFGIDPMALVRAARADFATRRIAQGGSTLTMQLVERAYPQRERTVTEKLRTKWLEFLMAARLEWHAWQQTGDRRSAKETLLSAYLGHIEFGHQTVGIREAAEFYFHKTPAKLTLGESAYLAGLVRGPSVNNAHYDAENARLARDAVVRNMEKLGQLSAGEREDATFYVASERRPRSRQGDGFLSAAVRRELQTLVERGELTAAEAGSPSLRLRLARDSAIQQVAETSLLEQLASIESDRRFAGEKGHLQGSVVVLDNRTGGILASVGGRNFDRLAYDCALQAKRTAASAAKPFLYASYLEDRTAHITDLISNEALDEAEFPGLPGSGDPDETRLLEPGLHPLWKGLAYSSNRMTLRAGALTRPSAWASRMHPLRLIRNPSVPSTNAWLGSFDVRPVDLAAAYAVFPRRGSYTEPYLIREVEAAGRTVYRRQPEFHSVMRAETCDEITGALREVLRVGTASGYGGKSLAADRDVAGKTGTSDGVYDAWFVGYSSDVTIAVWIGFPEGNRTILKDETGGSLAFPVWKKIIESLPGDYAFTPLAELPMLTAGQ